MSDVPSPSGGFDPDSVSQALIDRVAARLDHANFALKRRARTMRPKRRTPDLSQEARALRTVFVEMGDAYRRYRRLTGESEAPDVRDAALTFKREPSLSSLVAVAARLDRLDILAW